MGVKITPAQMRALRQMADADSRWIFGLNSTNMTGCALQRLGLAKFRYNNVMVSGVGRWHITEAGRAYLASVDTHAKRGDSTQIGAPSPMGSAVGEAETPNPYPSPQGSKL